MPPLSATAQEVVEASHRIEQEGQTVVLYFDDRDAARRAWWQLNMINRLED